MSPRRPDLPALQRAALDPHPLLQIAAWLELARAEVPLAEAMTLATVDAAGRPDARTVLLKGVDRRGLRFYTNRDSAKAVQLAANPAASVVIYWRELDRQVRARGTVEELPLAESDAYFASRPRDSQLGAWASAQSRPLASRRELEKAVAEVESRFAERVVTRPPHWGGYLLAADEVELWQGREGRLHDRFRYRRAGGGWAIERLSP